MAATTPITAPTGRTHRPMPAHTTTEVVGLLMISGALAMMLLAGLVTGLSLAEGSFLLPFIAAPAVGALLAWRYGWGRPVGMVLGIVTAVMTFWLGFGLFVLDSFVEFTTGVAWLVGVALTLYGGIGAIVRRRELLTETAHSEVLLDRSALGLVALALVVSLPMWWIGRTTVDEVTTVGMPVVSAANFAFEDITVTAGEETAIVVRNRDAFVHTFTIDELGIDVELLPGSAAVVDLPSTPGEYLFYCVPHSSDAGNGEDDMAATLTIE